uniref:ATP synthase F0 subunit b n=1 Tax=Campylaephora kondoi TaxID=218449 RepID=UPI002E78A727|nr:ATP synthase F0 subunit b [Campylaephora kondoi]YP_011017638.1 ATP synthase F0 subunit b [Campylaephora kondoi]WQF69458.1 ATP synthase F0 subunit b [Campylaephora kondoi]WQF69461.1 ATP synthase F0 subunit b [Campylaephora kondoi]
MKVTFNFGIFLLMFLLVKFNILLLNEESLILLVFITFCILSTVKLGPLTSSFFELQQNDVKLGIKSSTQKLIELFTQQKLKLGISSNWETQFYQLKSHLINFNKLVLLQIPNFYQMCGLIQLKKQLSFSRRLEQQVMKLISLIILEKLNKILVTQEFCNNVLVSKKFKTSDKINLREHLTKI